MEDRIGGGTAVSKEGNWIQMVTEKKESTRKSTIGPSGGLKTKHNKEKQAGGGGRGTNVGGQVNDDSRLDVDLKQRRK